MARAAKAKAAAPDELDFLEAGEVVTAERTAEDGSRIIVTNQGRKVSIMDGVPTRLTGPEFSWEQPDAEFVPAEVDEPELAEPETPEPEVDGEASEEVAES